MLKKIFIPTILVILAYGFWVSPDFKEIAAGVSIFLFGMLFLEAGFKAFTGGILEKVLQRTTNTLPKSIGFGVISTTIMQSSSLVSVITISFISAGLITLAAGIGIIFGANIGTTTGAWLVAGFGLKVKISAYAMPMLAFGIVLTFQKSKALKGIGSVLAGLGFLFLGIHHMKEGFEAFRDQIDLARFAIEGYPGLFLFAFIGLAATVVMQSSHATLVLIITALAAAQITYDNALALAIGANIGTTITAIIGSLSANVQGKRLAGAHLIFNVVTGTIAIVFISQLVLAVDWVSAAVGIAADNYTLKLAVFHTIFNVIGVIVMVPFVGKLVLFLENYLPEPSKSSVEPLYLNDAAIEFPDTVLESVRKETWHLYECAIGLMSHGINMTREMVLDSEDLKKTIDADKEIIEFDIDQMYESQVKKLYGSILEFITKAGRQLPAVFSEQIFWLRQSSINLVECVKHVKHLRKNTSRYMVSRNESMRVEYNKLRFLLASTMRLVHEVGMAEDPRVSADRLKEQKKILDVHKTELNATVDRLLHDGVIDSDMATSLLNDFNYTRGFVKRLVKFGNTLITLHEHEVKAADVEDPETVDEEDFEEGEQQDVDREEQAA